MLDGEGEVGGMRRGHQPHSHSVHEADEEVERVRER